MDEVTIYHNPACGTSRNTLGLIRNAGIEPQVIEYLRTQTARATLLSLISAMGVPVRAVVRATEPRSAALGLADDADADLLAALLARPMLINRPIVVTAQGTKLCRPSEAVLDILPQPQRGAFSKEDGEPVVDAAGNRIV